VADQPQTNVEGQNMQVRITENGPYRVSGSTPLTRTAVVETEHGEPVAWAPDEPLTAGRSYSLCRCGHSATKPFCDDSHLANAFDGAEVADRGPRAERMRVFEGDGMEMTDDPSLCTHVGFCTNRRTHVWDLIAQTEDETIRAQLLEMIRLCPSGRLAHRPSADARESEPELDPGVAVVRDGPLWLRGGIEVIGADGIPYERRNRVTLCRCGHSRNKPFCDGSHFDVGFRDPASAIDAGDRAARVAPGPDGPSDV
jgi:CDGSH-type Zn-finger protein